MKIVNGLVFLGFLAFFPVPLQAQDTENVPVYNTSASVLPLTEMAAGRNAPSYVYNSSSDSSSSSSSFSNPNAALASAPMSSADALALRAQRDALAQQYESEYYASLQNGQGIGWQGGGRQGLPGILPSPEPQPQPPVQRVERRVIYRELNDPLAPPPRLIDPDR